MKTHKLLFAILIFALTLVGCSKVKVDDTTDSNTQTEPLNVTLSLDRSSLSNSRGTGNFDATTPELINGRVFFLNSQGNVLESYPVNQVDIISQSGQQFSGVNANATEVYVIANHVNIGDADTKLSTLSLLSNLRAYIMELSSQQTNHLQVVMANSNDDEHTALITEVVGQTTQSGEKMYEAKVRLAPTLSRIQFYDIKTTDERIKSYNLAGVYIDSYYEYFATNTDGIGSNMFYTVGDEAVELGKNTGLFDTYANIPANNGEVSAQTAGGGVVGDSWNYQVSATTTPDGNTKTDVPAIIIHLTNVKYTASDGSTKTMENAYITVNSYTSGVEVIRNFEAGKVYQIPSGEFVFDLSNLDDTPNAKDQNLTVYVTVSNWQEVSVTPDL